MQRLLKNYPKRGEIYVADLGPVLIISGDNFNETMHTVVMLPLSSIIPIFIGPDMMKFSKIKGLHKESVILLTQIRAIDKDRLIEKVGKTSKIKMKEVEESLKLVLGFTDLV